MGTNGGYAEARRHNSNALFGANKKWNPRSNYVKEYSAKPFYYLLQDIMSRKMLYLKLALMIIACSTVAILCQFPTQEGYRSTFLTMRPMSGAEKLDTGYTSHLKIDWARVSKAIQVGSRNEDYRVGLLNFNREEIEGWEEILPNAIIEEVHLEHVPSNVTWNHLYPEWINEEDERATSCPHFPEPEVPEESHYDLIAVKLPCQSVANWTKDVARLHLQQAAARLAVGYARPDVSRRVLIVSRCFPIPNLFKCKKLVAREENVWLYEPDVDDLIEKLKLPVGSCKLALPFKQMEQPYLTTRRREAYATILHSDHVYICGAIAAAQSLKSAGTDRDLIILVDETIGNYNKNGLKAAGWQVRTIKRIRYPKAQPDAYNEWNYSKFWLWRLTEYDKIIFIDADILIQRNPNVLFTMPELSATGNNGSLFNSGVMVIEPSNCTFQLLMDHIADIESYNGGDQGYLNEIFSWWHRLPSHMNYLKHFWVGDTNEIKDKKTKLFAADPPILFVIHFVGMKPWFCYKDYDCNWNVDELQQFASDAAHAKFWEVHDAMPKYLQSFCLLNEKQKALLEWDIMRAKAANFTSGHWSRKIADPREGTCAEQVFH